MNHNPALRLRGVRENNLKSLDLDIPHDRLIAITGLSGSGKSSLAFDTIYAEGGRRYIETFSPYTRQFLDRLHRPKLDAIDGVRPAIALEQRNRINNSRSTVGTVTEINDFLKVIWAQLAEVVCPDCGLPVESDTPPNIVRRLESDAGAFERLAVGFPVRLSGQATAESLRTTLEAEGFVRYFSERKGEIARLADASDEELQGESLIIVLERLQTEAKSLTPEVRERLMSALRQCYRFGHGTLIVLGWEAEGTARILSFCERPQCGGCGKTFSKAKASLFSFNSPIGACATCRGFGQVLTIDRELCVPDPSLSITEGAVACWDSPSTTKQLRALKTFCQREGIDIRVPWRKLSKSARERIFSADKRTDGFVGIEAWFAKLQRKIYKMHVRVFLSRYRRQVSCPDCGGTRLRPEALAYRLAGATLPEIWNLSIDRAHAFFTELKQQFPLDQPTVVAFDEVISRLGYLLDVGLHYLTLNRQSRTLSGGESQRVNLTSILGARLVNCTLVLDEPSIGLHARDTARLIRVLRALRDRGNTVIVVEHDNEIVRACDHIIDLGPRAGSAGGEVVYSGPASAITSCDRSITATYLSRPLNIASSSVPADANDVVIEGARAQNLKDITVRVPLGGFVALCGVSGSGKSSLIRECLVEVSDRLAAGGTLRSITSRPDAPLRGLRGLEAINEIVLVDQSPVGKTPRSNAATYTKAWDLIREAFALTPGAEQLGVSKSAFSFNTDGGRCSTCKGAGALRIEMQFLADVFVECETCNGARFKDQILGVKLGGKSVVDILEMTLEDAVSFFGEIATDRRDAIRERLAPLIELGLGYLRLGQPLSELSGGEAQRVKLARYLGESGAKPSLFILDEPTTGLHAHDVTQLIQALRRLVSLGHSVLCVEHNLDVLAQADYLIELGPGGGAQGGSIVAEGAPAQLVARRSLSTPTLEALRQGTCAPQLAESRADAHRAAGTSRDITIAGAREHNLKDVTVTIPRNKLSVVTGVSGSGKSTLAFDVLFSEGQRRYIDCLSPYARQFITQLKRPDIDRIENIPPTIAVSQKTAPPLGISTIGTTTEIYQYLRLLFTKVGEQHCPEHDVPIERGSSDSLADGIIARFKGQRVFLFAPVVSGRKGNYTELLNRALRAEITEARIDGEMVTIEQNMRLERHKLHWISLLVGSITPEPSKRDLLCAAVEQCLLLGNGVLEVSVGKRLDEPLLMSTDRVCPVCRSGFRELDPQDFSFRSRRGVCDTCEGWGRIGKDEELCPECEGARIGPIGRSVRVRGRRIHELCSVTAPQLLHEISRWQFEARLAPIVDPLLEEIRSRLQVTIAVGLDYLSLDRESSTLSGGEAQRLRLARTLGSPLTGICYVLDEPTIGLHPQDHGQVIRTLQAIRDAGNTVVVVEHDEETIRQADHVIDIGPQGGAGGGRVIATGTVADICAAADSLTGAALRKRGINRKGATAVAKRAAVTEQSESLRISNVRTNNLRALAVEIPFGKLAVVAGVSGAGKSSLVHGSLVPAVEEALNRKRVPSRLTYDGMLLENAHRLQRLVEIDQSPVGRTPASNPASYLGVFDEIRKLYAMTPEAMAEGWGPGYFSFNSKGGRCEACKGRGSITIPMSFLSDAHVMCEDCGGLRYEERTLAIEFQGMSIGQLLQKTIDEARAIFINHPKIRRPLDYVQSLGLGYLTIGQPTNTLSGGEAQRLKIARELGSRSAVDTLYVLDEPTTGLHMLDVDKLLATLRSLAALGNTIVVIEHNLDIICGADYVIELGPGPGDKGGQLLYAGHPGGLSRAPSSSPTRAVVMAERRRERAVGSKQQAISEAVA